MISVRDLLESNSMIRRTVLSKKHAAAGAGAMGAARKNDDPAYKQLQQLNMKRALLKAKLQQKYKAAGKLSAKRVH